MEIFWEMKGLKTEQLLLSTHFGPKISRSARKATQKSRNRANASKTTPC